ncbi:MAG: virulence RhuM family protein, partial [Lachnospiraceae bacterium]|nr:virulence RhuM family protein [Lachnospiraceae bacterium]
VRMEGNRQITRELPFYNLDMIISLGYRVNAYAAQSASKQICYKSPDGHLPTALFGARSGS